MIFPPIILLTPLHSISSLYGQKRVVISIVFLPGINNRPWNVTDRSGQAVVTFRELRPAAGPPDRCRHGALVLSDVVNHSSSRGLIHANTVSPRSPRFMRQPTDLQALAIVHVQVQRVFKSNVFTNCYWCCPVRLFWWWVRLVLADTILVLRLPDTTASCCSWLWFTASYLNGPSLIDCVRRFAENFKWFLNRGPNYALKA